MSESVSKKKIVIWNTLGSLSVGGISVLMLLVVARLLPVSLADSYSLAYAFGHLMFILALFQVRNFQATDTCQTYSFEVYVSARLLTSLLALVLTVLYGYMSGYSAAKFVTLLLITSFRVTDALSDVFQGLFQQHQRIDLAGKSLFWRNTLVLLSFTLILWYFRELNLALVVINLVSLIAILILDVIPARSMIDFEVRQIHLRQVFNLLKDCLPLFLSGFLLVFIYNQPKYSIDVFLESGQLPAGSQTIFNIIFMPAFVMNLLIIFLRPIFTQLALHLQERDVVAFKHLKNKLLLGLAFVSGLSLVLGYYLGLPILGQLYGLVLSSYRDSFILLLLGGVLSSFANVFDQLLTIARQQRLLLVAYLLSFVVSYVSADYFVGQFGLTGAAMMFVLAMLVWLSVLMAFYLGVFRKVFEHEETSSAV